MRGHEFLLEYNVTERVLLRFLPKDQPKIYSGTILVTKMKKLMQGMDQRKLCLPNVTRSLLTRFNKLRAIWVDVFPQYTPKITKTCFRG
jgi:hypothetical protein